MTNDWNGIDNEPKKLVKQLEKAADPKNASSLDDEDECEEGCSYPAWRRAELAHKHGMDARDAWAVTREEYPDPRWGDLGPIADNE